MDIIGHHWTSLDRRTGHEGHEGHETQLNSRRNRANLGRSHPQREPNLSNRCNGWVSQGDTDMERGDDTDTKDTERHGYSGYRLLSCDETCNAQARPFNLSTLLNRTTFSRYSQGIPGSESIHVVHVVSVHVVSLRLCSEGQGRSKNPVSCLSQA